MDLMMSMGGWAITSVVAGALGWAVSTLFGTRKLHDLVGCFTFATMATASYFLAPQQKARQALAVAMVDLWALRLGFYLFHRALRFGLDRRAAHAADVGALKHLMMWVMQSLVWVLPTIFPVLLANSVAAGQLPKGCQALCWVNNAATVLGVVLYTLGTSLECVADAQKYAFKTSGQSGFIHHGVWAWSRHPNYAGEIMLWWGVAVVCAAHIASSSAPTPLLLGVWLGPVAVHLLLSRVSGVPPLEKLAEEHYGHLQAYKDYKRRTPLLFPRFCRTPPRASAAGDLQPKRE